MPHITRFSQRRRTLALVQIALSAACLALCAWITIPFLVPFTMQTFAVFAILLLFGWKRGILALLLYLAIGAIGLPVFSGFGGGLGILLGPTGGYLIGFLAIALVYALWGKCLQARPSLALFALFCGLLVCYAFGAGWYCLLYAEGRSFWQILEVTALPFLLPDLIKLLLAGLVAAAVKRARLA